MPTPVKVDLVRTIGDPWRLNHKITIYGRSISGERDSQDPHGDRGDFSRGGCATTGARSADDAEVLYDYAQHAGDTPEGEFARELVVVRNNQRVFAEAVEQYLSRVDFSADGYARLIRLPQYRVAEVTVDPDHAFGRPRFTRGGASLEDLIDLFRAGEPVDAVAEEFGLTRDEVEDAIREVA